MGKMPIKPTRLDDEEEKEPSNTVVTEVSGPIKRRKSLVLDSLSKDQAATLNTPQIETLKSVDSLFSPPTAPGGLKERRRSMDQAFGFKRPVARKSTAARKISAFLDMRCTGLMLCIVTVIALFAFDINNAALPKECDAAVLVLISFCFAVFTVEVILSSYVNIGYAGSFFWLLDVVGTLSMIPDMLQIVDGMGNSGFQTDLDVAKAGKAGRIARSAGSLRITKYARIFRIVRLVRVVRLLRIISKSNPGGVNDNDIIDDENQQQRPSKIGKLLSELISKRVIILVILLISILPQLEQEIGGSTISIATVLQSLEYSSNSTYFDMAVQHMLNRTNEIVFAKVAGVTFKMDYAALESLRDTEIWATCLPECTGDKVVREYDSVLVMSLVDGTKKQAIFQIILCVFIILVFGIGSFIITRDVHNLIVLPIERMTKVIRKLASTVCILSVDNSPEDDAYETHLLENVVQKMAGMFDVEPLGSKYSASQPTKASRMFLGSKQTDIVTSTGTYTVIVNEKFNSPKPPKIRPEKERETDLGGFSSKQSSLKRSMSFGKQAPDSLQRNARHSISNSSILSLTNQYEELASISSILHDPIASQYLRHFMAKNLVAENYLFYTEVNKFKNLVQKQSKRIYAVYISSKASNQVNISALLRAEVTGMIEQPNMPANIFDDCQSEILHLMELNCYNKFLSSSSCDDFLKRKKEDCKSLLDIDMDRIVRNI